MTIHITIKNNDTRPDCVISGEQLLPDGSLYSQEHQAAYRKNAGPGETLEFHVHDTNQIVVREVSPSPMKAPAPPRFPKDARVKSAPGTSRGPEDGLPWSPDREPAVGTALGLEYTTAGGQCWTGILWDDAEDPDWHKTDCLVAAD